MLLFITDNPDRATTTISRYKTVVNTNDPTNILHITHEHWGYGSGVENTETLEGVWLRSVGDGTYLDEHDNLYGTDMEVV